MPRPPRAGGRSYSRDCGKVIEFLDLTIKNRIRLTQAGDGGEHLVELDRMHAARLRTFLERAAAAAHPVDLPAEKEALVAAREGIAADRAPRRVAPEGAGARE